MRARLLQRIWDLDSPGERWEVMCGGIAVMSCMI